jgi:adenosylhomocysteine nucleosidase
MKRILILSAFPDEQKHYINTLKTKETKCFGFVKTTICEYKNTLIYLATTGMGTINAALTLATIAAQVPFDAVFFSGTSGGIDARLKIGDVVVATETFDADIFSIHDNVIGTPFEGALVNPNKEGKTPRFFNAHAKLLEPVKTDKWAFSVFQGRIASSNHFPSPAELFADIKAKNAMAIDMESTALYQFAWASNLPCLAVRGISNILDHKGTDDDVANSDVASSDHAAMLVLDCVDALITSHKSRPSIAKL